MLVRAESLNRIFKRHNNAAADFIRYDGKCRQCGRDTRVEIIKTSGGYGLQGGVLYESNNHNFLILCSGCFKKSNRKHDGVSCG